MPRNLSIRSKLLPVLAVPVAGAVLLGLAGVAPAWGDRTAAVQQRRLAALAAQATAAIHELQEERVRSVAWSVGGGTAAQRELAARRRRTDRALAAYRSGAAALGPAGGPALGQAVAAASERLDRLAVARDEVDRRLVGPDQAAAELDTMVAALLAVTRALADGLDAPEPGRVARLLLAVAAAKEATGQERTLLAATPATGPPAAGAKGTQASGTAGPGAPAHAAGPATTAKASTAPSGAPAGPTTTARANTAPGGTSAGPTTTGRAATTSAGAAGRPARSAGAGGADEAALTVRLTASAAVARGELNGLREAAGERLDRVDRALGAPAVRELRGLELALLEPAAMPPPRALPGDPEAWRAGLAARSGTLWGVEREVAADLARASAAWSERQQRRARDRLALAAGVAGATLTAALAAWKVAAGAGRRPPATGPAVPGLARRGQALADRQLELLEDLTRDEPDPLRRQGLLGVDHLANRLRRTAETLLAVAGEPARQGARPLPVAALLRAAVAEAEPGGAPREGTPTGPGLHGPGEPMGGPAGRARHAEPGWSAPVGPGRRVDLLTAGDAEVDGAAGTDLVHLLAELLDNAAAFSPPTAPIVVSGAADGDGYLIEVSDRGLGMTDQELSWANQRLAGARPEHGAAADRLGLLIAGRLATRNGFGVRLGRSPAGGVTAVVRLPAERLAPRPGVPARRA